MQQRKVLRVLRGLADEYGFQFIGRTSKGHYKWRHRTNGRLLVTISSASSFHSFKNTEQTMRQVSNGQHANEN